MIENLQSGLSRCFQVILREGGGSTGVILTVRRSEEVVKQVEEQVVEEKRRNLREVEMGELLCLADLKISR